MSTPTTSFLAFPYSLKTIFSPSKQRPFVLPLPDPRDHQEADGGGVHTGIQESLSDTGCEVAQVPGQGKSS